MTIITLDASDMLLATQAGAMRNIENIIRKRKPAYGAEQAGDFQLHVVGAMGELALSRYLNVTWNGKGKFRGPDAGTDIQVRTAERNGRISLILHEQDPDELLFYCVRRFEGSNEFEIFQPVRGREGKSQRYWRTDVRSPAFFVPVKPIGD